MACRVKTWLVSLMCVCSAVAVGGSFQVGRHQWNVKDGRLIAMVGLITDDGAHSYLKG